MLKENKRIILIAILIIMLVLLLALSFFFITSPKERDYHKFAETEKITYCKSGENCHTAYDITHSALTIDYDNEELQGEVKKINDNTNKYIKEVKKSDLSSVECASVRSMYNYRYKYYEMFYKYSGNDYISTMAYRVMEDLCVEGADKRIEPDVVIFDVKAKKILSQNEFIRKTGVTDSQIQKNIKSTIDYLSKEIYKKEIAYDGNVDDYKLFYDEGKVLKVVFYCKTLNNYQVATIKN